MNRLNMNFSGYPFDGNFSQTSNEVPSNETSYSVPNKRKKMESETESKEEKIASLTKQRFNGSDIEEPPIKQRKVVKGDQKGKENIEESETVIDVPEMAHDELWKHLKDCLSNMSLKSFFCFPGELKVERDLIKELLKNPPVDSLKDLCAVQTVNCKKDGEKVTLNGFERACLKQHSQVFKHIFSFHQEADIQTPIDWTIKKSILELFLKSLYHPNILDEQKEEILIELLDQANLYEAEQLTETLVGKIQKHIILSIREKGDEGLARITNYWHEFASIRGLSSLQRSCEYLLINHFWFGKAHHR